MLNIRNRKNEPANDLLAKAADLQSVGQILLRSERPWRGRKKINLAARLYEEAGDRQADPGIAIRNYQYAVNSFYLIENQLNTRRVYRKQLEHYKALARSAQESYDGNAVIYAAAQIVLQESIKLLSPLRCVAREFSSSAKYMFPEYA